MADPAPLLESRDELARSSRFEPPRSKLVSQALADGGARASELRSTFGTSTPGGDPIARDLEAGGLAERTADGSGWIADPEPLAASGS